MSAPFVSRTLQYSQITFLCRKRVGNVSHPRTVLGRFDRVLYPPNLRQGTISGRAPPVVRISGLIGQFNSFATISRVSFSMRQKRVFNFLKTGKTKGAATVHVLYKLDLPSRKGTRIVKFSMQARDRRVGGQVNCVDRGFSLCRSLAMHRGLHLFKNVCNIGTGRVDGHARRALRHVKLCRRRRALIHSLPLK